VTSDPAAGSQRSTISIGQALLLRGALLMLIASAALGTGAGASAGEFLGGGMNAHVHLGSLGWMTLAVLGVAVAMLDEPSERLHVRLEVALSALALVAVVAFVVATATHAVAGQAWAGTAAMAALMAFVVHLAVRWRSSPVISEATLAMAAALMVLLGGSVLGVLSASAADSGKLDSASDLASSHAAVLSVPFVLLAGTALVAWSAGDRVHTTPSAVGTAGLVQVGLLLLGAAALFGGALTDSLALVEANVPLQAGGIGLFLVRVGARVLERGWLRRGRAWLVTCSLFLAVEVGLFAHVVFEIGRQRYPSIDLVPEWLLFAVDHVTLVGIGTAALFGAVAAISPRAGELWEATDAPAAAGTAVGLAGMAAGIGVKSQAVEIAFGAISGVSLLVAAAAAARRVHAMRRPSAAGGG